MATVKKSKWVLLRHKTKNHYASESSLPYGASKSDYEVVPNDIIFNAVLFLNGTYGQRDSGWGFHWKDATTGAGYRMFGKDVEIMLRCCIMENGVVSGRWQFKNAGGALGVQYLGKEETNG